MAKGVILGYSLYTKRYNVINILATSGKVHSLADHVTALVEDLVTSGGHSPTPHRFAILPCRLHLKWEYLALSNHFLCFDPYRYVKLIYASYLSICTPLSRVFYRFSQKITHCGHLFRFESNLAIPLLALYEPVMLDRAQVHMRFPLVIEPSLLILFSRS